MKQLKSFDTDNYSYSTDNHSEVRYFYRKEESKKKGLIWLLLLILSLLLTTTLSYSYWDGNINPINNNQINVGVGTSLQITETIRPIDGSYLVPDSVFMGPDDVTEIILGYDVTLNKQGRLSITASDILVDGQPDAYNLIVIDIYLEDPNEIASNSLLTTLTEQNVQNDFIEDVYVRVSLNMPADEAEYNYIRLANISFTLEFEALELEE
jgi:hypothetical protein